MPTKKELKKNDEGVYETVDVPLDGADLDDYNARLLVGKKSAVLADLAAEFAARFHANYPAVDASAAPCEIQLRDATDRQNVSDVAQAAARMAETDPTQQVGFRCQDNIIHPFVVGDFVDLSVAIFADRQGVLHTYWQKRDAVVAVEPTAENEAFFDDYDAAAGW